MEQAMSANDHQPLPAEAATDVEDDYADEFDRSFGFVAIFVVVSIVAIGLLALFWPS